MSQMQWDLVVRGARTVHDGGTGVCDVAVVDGLVAEIGENLAGEAIEDVDGRGKLLLPGGIDPHVHFENPSWDTATAHDFGIGTEAAALGGTTTIIDFAYQAPGEPAGEAVTRRRTVADPKVVTDYALHGTVTDPSFESVETLPGLPSVGSTSVKIFMAYSIAGLMVDDAQLLAAMEQVKKFDGIMLVHAENDSIVEHCRHHHVSVGDVQASAHARSRPVIAEVEAIRRVLTFAEEVGCRVYIVHLSTSEGLDAIKEARARGVQVHTETCPHYLSFDASVLDGEAGPRYVMSPPLRSKFDSDALWAGLADGSIEALGSDDAAYVLSDKDRAVNDFRDIPNGVPGAQVRTSVAFSFGYRTGRLSLERYVELVSTNPAKLFGLYPRKGHIAVGVDADLALWDEDIPWRGDLDSIHTNIGYTCYENVEFVGKPVDVWSRGRRVVRDGLLAADRGSGQYLDRGPSVRP